MEVFAVVEKESDRYGESYGPNILIKIFSTEDKAKEYSKWLKRDRIFGSGKGGHFNSKIVVKKVKVEN